MTPRQIIVEVAKMYGVPEHDVEITYSVPAPHDGSGTDRDLWLAIRFRSKFSYGRGRSHTAVQIRGEGETPSDALDDLSASFMTARNAHWQRERKAKQKREAKRT